MAPSHSLPPHDHSHCVSETLARAKALAEARGLKLTPLRLRVLEIVAESHRPIGAYDILARLSQERSAKGARAAPPTVYRTLDFLMAAGYVHRIDSLNAFVACFEPAHAQSSLFLLCEGCGAAEEMTAPALSAAVEDASRAKGFGARRVVLELHGRCQSCRATTLD